MASQETPPQIKELIMCNNIDSCKTYMRIMIDFLFNLTTQLRYSEYNSQRLNEIPIWVQTMLTNTLSFESMLNGVSYNSNNIRLNPIIDTRIIFSVSRVIYENLIVFELIYILQHNDEERDLIYGLFEAAGYKEKIDANKNRKTEYEELCLEDEDCYQQTKREVLSNVFYKNASSNTKKQIDNALNSGMFRFIVQDDNTLKRIIWDEAHQLISDGSSLLDNIYKYLSNQSHPSHWGLLQFDQAYKKENPEYINLACFASKTVIICISIFIADLRKKLPMADSLFNSQNTNIQQLLLFYSNIVRKQNHRTT